MLAAPCPLPVTCMRTDEAAAIILSQPRRVLAGPVTFMGQDSGGLFKKGRRYARRGGSHCGPRPHRPPVLGGGGSLAIVFGVTNPTAMLSLAANDARVFDSADH